MSGNLNNRDIRDLAAGPTRVAPFPGIDRNPLLARKQLRVGDATTPIRGEYYDHDRTIAVAGLVDPVNPDSPVYNRERIHNDIGQNAEFVQVINRGTDNLFVRSCHEGQMQFTDETVLAPGVTKWYVNIYELRCRSPTQGLPYTVTEYYMRLGCCPTSSIASANEAKLIRFDKLVDPTWVHAAEVTAPAAGTALVSQTVSAGVSGFFFGFYIDTQEVNDFLITWTSGGVGRQIRITFAGKGTLESVDLVAVNEGLPADTGTTITISNVTAGNAGIIYQARLLYAEI